MGELAAANHMLRDRSIAVRFIFNNLTAMRRTSLRFCVTYIALGGLASCARGVELNGIPIQNATSTFEITREV